jgi:hypothetical protein
MDRLLELRHLAEANRRIHEGSSRLDAQEALVARLNAVGADTSIANAVLTQFRSTLEELRTHRGLIEAALAEQSPMVG